jgi:branched-chain amino acid transport system ATP-binding protein
MFRTTAARFRAEVFGAEFTASAAPPRVNARSNVILALEDIVLSFGGVTVLSDVSLTVREGEIRAIIGPNGAGKSSLINVISGAYHPDSGRVWIGDQSFDHVPPHRLAAFGVARTFQNLALFRGLDVVENIISGLAFRTRSNLVEQVLGVGRAACETREAQTAAEEVIAMFRLEEVRFRLARTLPYGLQKRVELARALVARPRLLLLDEPLAGMTATEKQEMARFIRVARDHWGTTIIMIEHDIGVVMGLSDRVAVLDYGRMIADGVPDEVRSDQAVIDAYLGVPHDIEHGAAI